MWIKTESGELLNSANVDAFQLVVTDLSVRIEAPPTLVAHLHNKAEADALIDRIAAALANEEVLFDVNASVAPERGISLRGVGA
jgi:hypothetical protein